MAEQKLVREKAAPAPQRGAMGLLQRKCACGGSAGLAGTCESCRSRKLAGLQAKLMVNQPGDIYEREADRLADQVMSMSGAGPGSSPAPEPVAVSHTPEVGMSRSSQGETDGVAPPLVQDVLRSPGTPLDSTTQGLMSSRFGHDFSRVRVHTDALASESARSVDAAAYTVGNHIAFADGHYAPGTGSGRHLLAHELAHVLQQTGAPAGGHAGSGRVSAAPAGYLQRQEPKATASGERGGAMAGKDKKEAKDKFSFKADLTIPVTDALTFGSLSILNELKLSGSTAFLGTPLGNGPTDTDPVKLELAMALVKLQLEKFKEKSEALKRGNLSFSAALNSTGGTTFSFNPDKTERSLASALSLKFGATTPSLIPSPYGQLTFGTSVSAGGSLTRTDGPDGTFTPKADSAVSLTGAYESKASKNRYLTLGRILGDEASVTAGFDLGGTGAITPDKMSGGLSAGGSLGLTGTRKGVKQFIKLQVKGDIAVDRKTGSAATSTNSFFLGLATGFSF